MDEILFFQNLSEDILERIDGLEGLYSLSKSNISEMFASYLLSKSIDEESVTIDILDDFEKEKLYSNATGESEVKLKKPKILMEMNFNQYVVEGSDSELKTAQKSEIKEDLIFNDFEPENYVTNSKNEAIWDVTLHNDDVTYLRMYQPCLQILEAIEKQGLEVVHNSLDTFNAGLCDPSSHINVSDLAPVDTINQEVNICGIISVDHIHSSSTYNPEEDSLLNVSTKLTTDNIVISGYSEMKSVVVPLNLEQLSTYALFTGQNVIIRGHNFSKTEFVAREIITKKIRPSLPISRADIPGNLRILVASGPFSSINSDDDIIRIAEIIKKLSQEHGDVLILTGPFIDIQNDFVEKRSETELYSSMLSERLLFIAKCCIKLNVHVVFVPSTNDAGFADSVFPQPKFDNLSDYQEFQHGLVHFAANPSIINIGPYVFGVSSVDILRHLSLQEINKNHIKGIKRHCQHILEENNFYPLKPAHHEVSVDWTLWPKCNFRSNPPHCLILPSLLSNFAEEVSGVLCVNPGVISNKKTCSMITIHADRIKENACSIISATTCKFINI